MTQLLTLLPVLTAYLIFLGIQYTVRFYDKFNINIINYFDFSDIFQLQFKLYFKLFGISLVICTFLSFALFQYTNTYPDFKLQNIYGKIPYLIRLCLGLVLLILGIVCPINFVNYIADQDSDKFINHQSDHEVIVRTQDRIVITDKNLVFIGQTKSYLFFRDFPSEKTEIIDVKDIKEIAFKKGINHNEK